MRTLLPFRKIGFSLVAVVSLAVALQVSAQEVWYYNRAIKFPPSDTAQVRPYALTIDAKGNIWVISSAATDTAAHNSVWEAGPKDTTFTKVVDFGSYYDPASSSYFDKNVGTLRGISALGQDIYLSGNQPYPLTQPNTVSFIYILRNGSVSDSVHLGYGMRGGGFGTYIDCIQMTNDSIAFVGCPYDPNHVGPSWRAYNMTGHQIVAYDKAGTPSTRNFGYFLLGDPAYAYSGYYSPAPGGPMDANATDEIRSIALIPGMNYADSANAIKNSYFFTSRSSSPVNPSTGGIAIWTGGYDRQPSLYSAKQVTDVAGDLSLGSYTYYGIAADSSGNLFVCRADSGYKWVKIFKVVGTFATEIGHLPSKTDPNNPDPKGAPFQGPTAVTLSPDQREVYVADQAAREVFVFSTTITKVDGGQPLQPYHFALRQNYPNPFNPTTIITYELEKSGRVSLSVFNVLGEKVATLIDGVQSAGIHTVSFDGSNLPSGLYFYSLQSIDRKITRKMILIR